MRAALSDWLLREHGEELSFAHFMTHALGHPQWGYYARRVQAIGKGGDFTTTAEIAPALGRAVACWLKQALAETACQHVIELGPGSGRLAEAVMRHLPWWRRRGVVWHLVESASALREQQQKRAWPCPVRWHTDVADALRACEGAACVYSNEFFDALPIRIFRHREACWQELWLKWTESVSEAHAGWSEVWRDATELPDSTLWGHPDAQKARIEVAVGVQQWLQAMLPHWQHGAMLMIDYGSAVTGQTRLAPLGSVRAYWRQQRWQGPAVYQNPGHQDLTYDVNFTDVQHWARPWVVDSALQTQRDFLLSHIRRGHAGDAAATAIDGAGAAFMAWTCRRGKGD